MAKIDCPVGVLSQGLSMFGW